MGRRAWLLGVIAVAALALVGVIALRPNAPGEPVEVTGFAMGTFVRVVADGPRAAQAAEQVMPLLQAMTQALDRFEPDSDVSRINARAGRGPVRVQAETVAVVQDALRLAHLTEGAFDPTVGPLVDLWGFVQTEEAPADGEGTVRGRRPPAPEAIAQVLERVGYQHLRVDEEASTVELVQPGMGLDLGGIAKGAAVDRVAQLFRDVGVERALIDLGGNLYALGRKADGSPWRVGIRHPRNPGAVLAIVEARDVAIATSGDYERYFIHEGVRYSHLLDPRTGSPARELASVTILAPKGVDADGLSTAVFVLGPEDGAQLVESLPGVEAIFVDPAMNVTYTSGLEGRIEVLTR